MNINDLPSFRELLPETLTIELNQYTFLAHVGGIAATPIGKIGILLRYLRHPVPMSTFQSL